MPEPQAVERVTGSDSPRFFVYGNPYSIQIIHAETWRSIGEIFFIMAIKRYCLGVLLFLLACVVPVNIHGQSKLQQYLDALAVAQTASPRASSSPTVIDLSEYDSDVTETLHIRNGINVEFRNGRLIRKFEGNLIVVQDGSTLTIGEEVCLLSQSVQGDYLVLIDGGKLIAQSGLINPCSLDGSTITANGIIYSGRNALYLTQSSDTLELNGSTIVTDVNCTNGNVICRKGICRTLSANELVIDMNGECRIDATVGNVVKVRNKLQNTINIKCYKTYGGIIAQGDEGYVLTQEDADSIIVTTNKWPIQINHRPTYKPIDTKLEDNKIVLIEKPITDAASLQYRLDRIVEFYNSISVTKKPDYITLDIPEEGIELNDSIIFRDNCHVVLQGGELRIADIKIESDIIVANPHYDPLFSIHKKADVAIQNININFHNKLSSRIFRIFGKLKIGENVNYKDANLMIGLNVDGNFYDVYDGAYLEINSGKTLCCRSVNARGNCEVVINDCEMFAGWYGDHAIYSEGILKINGGKISSGGFQYESSLISGNGNNTVYVTAGEFIAHTEEIFESFFIVGDAISETGHLEITGGNFTGGICCATGEVCAKDETSPSLGWIEVEESLHTTGSFVNTRINPNATITIGSPVTEMWYISCNEWDSVKIGRPIIKGDGTYTMAQNDYKNIVLRNLPCNLQTYFDKRDNSVKIINLQWVIDNSPLGNTEESDLQVEIPVPCEGLSIEQDISLEGLQALIDGKVKSTNECDDTDPIISSSQSEPSEDAPEIKMLNCRANITIGKNAIIELKNICIDGCDGSKKLYVDGTLVIDDYVYFRKFSDYAIHIRQGGCVIWRGGCINEGIQKLIYNDGGTFVMESGCLSGSTNSEAIVNKGKMYINGGKVNVDIITYNDLHLCGCASVTDIYLRGGKTIYITERLQIKLRIHVFIQGTFGDGSCIAIGTGGYVLTEEDLKLIEIILPDGYEWEYDNERHAIIVKESTGITATKTGDAGKPSAIYSLQGVKVGMSDNKAAIPAGIYVMDGRKIIIEENK